VSALICGGCGRQHSVVGLAAGTQVSCPCGQTLRLLPELPEVPHALRPTGTASADASPHAAAPSIPSAPPAQPVEERAAGVFAAGALDRTWVPDSAPRVGAATSQPDGAGAAGAPASTSGPGAREAAGGQVIGGLDATVVRGETQPRLPGFELLELYGRGGMGEVWRARQLSLGRTVAVKLLPEALSTDAEFVARFDKEATALATLNHPNIVQIIDRGREGQNYYFVMELVEGGSLRERMQGGRLPLSDVLQLVIQIARALEAAHEKGVVHRDLKPENVLLDGKLHVKVADFGLAGFRDDRARSMQLTASHVAMGTLNYMAPEQRREARSVDGRADLYSLGVMFYEMLTGDLPIGRFAPVQRRLPELDRGWDEVLEHLLESDPADRYASATELLADLEILRGRLSTRSEPVRTTSSAGVQPVLGRLATTPPPSRRHRLSPRLLWIGGLAALMLLSAGLLLQRSGLAGSPLPHTPPDEVESVASPGPGERVHPPNTNDALWAKAERFELDEGRAKITVTFEEGDEEVSGYEGSWRLEDGALRVEQAGNETSEEGAALRPRAYVSNRYFGADDFSVKLKAEVRELPPPYVAEPANSRFMEMSFRVAGLQVSLLAIPDSGLRLQWNYVTLGGRQVTGSSQEAIDQMIADVYPVPKGPFEVRLTLRRAEGGIRATGWVRSLDPSARKREVPFATALLPDLEGRVAKLALGCRNLACSFRDVEMEGQERERGSDRLAGRP